MIAGSAGVVATLMMGQGLDFLPFPINFISMFLLAAITGFIAVRFLAKTRLPKPESTAIDTTDLQVITRPRWREVLRGNTGVAFARLAIPVFLFNIGFHLAVPVVNIYYVEYMHFSKGSIGLLSAAFLVFQVLSSRFWGRMGDRLGNHVVAFISMAILIVQAALYSLVPSLPFILIMQIIGGFAFGGYAMSTFNSIIALGTPSNRPVVISLFNVVGGLGGFLSRMR
jgi:MFS family permease